MPVAGAHQVRIHEISCVVRASGTSNSELSVDLNVTVVGESEILTHIHRTVSGILYLSTGAGVT